MKPEKEKPQKRKKPKTKATNPQECTKEATSSPSDVTPQEHQDTAATEPEKPHETRKRKDAAGTSRVVGSKPKSSKSQSKKSKLVPVTELVVHTTLKTEKAESLQDKCDQVLPETEEKEENNLTEEKDRDLVKKKKKPKAQTRGDDKKSKAGRKKTAEGSSEIEGKETASVQEQTESEKTETEKAKTSRPRKKKNQKSTESDLEIRKTRKRKVPVAVPAEDSEKKPKLGAQVKATDETEAKKLVAKKGKTRRGGAKGDIGKKKTKENIVIEEDVNGGADAEDPNMAINATVAKAAKFVGAHMSISGGLDNAVKDAVATGSKAFALFLRSQRQWVAKPLEDKPAEKFRTACREHNFPPHLILPHGSYLLNCGSPSDETLRKSREALVDELERCEKLGLTRYNFHPGSTCGDITVEECLDKIGETINLVHQQTNKVMTVIENMSCQGNTVGGRFEELSGIIDRVKDKSRIGVCLDTCHAFAAGFDLSSESGYQDMMADFERIIGLKYLVAVHLNDSKGKVGSHLDRHENIGKGQIGLKAFRRLMNDSRFDNIPLILETPVGDGVDYAKEIKLLNSMVGKALH